MVFFYLEPILIRQQSFKQLNKGIENYTSIVSKKLMFIKNCAENTPSTAIITFFFFYFLANNNLLTLIQKE